MNRKALLIDYKWCTGCHTCEVACQMEHDYPVGLAGMKVNQIGPWQIDEDTWQFDNVPIPTDLCDGCKSRVSAGKLPSCVSHCQAKCMEYGPVTEFDARREEIGRYALFVL